LRLLRESFLKDEFFPALDVGVMVGVAPLATGQDVRGSYSHYRGLQSEPPHTSARWLFGLVINGGEPCFAALAAVIFAIIGGMLRLISEAIAAPIGTVSTIAISPLCLFLSGKVAAAKVDWIRT
jgi:hypothetical protein